jgi:hypothetical protein
VEALRRLRDELHWRAKQFKISIAVEQGTRSKKVWVEREITDYLAGGHNPFTGTFEKNQIQWGYGIYEVGFSEESTRPWGPDPRLELFYVNVGPGLWESKI